MRSSTDMRRWLPCAAQHLTQRHRLIERWSHHHHHHRRHRSQWLYWTSQTEFLIGSLKWPPAPPFLWHLSLFSRSIDFQHAKKMEADSPRIKSTLVSTGSTASLVASNRCRADRLLGKWKWRSACSERRKKRRQYFHLDDQPRLIGISRWEKPLMVDCLTFLKRAFQNIEPSFSWYLTKSGFLFGTMLDISSMLAGNFANSFN